MLSNFPTRPLYVQVAGLCDVILWKHWTFLPVAIFYWQSHTVGHMLSASLRFTNVFSPFCRPACFAGFSNVDAILGFQARTLQMGRP